jgi:hypothetical protein
MEEPQANATRSDGDHYRHMARKLRNLASQFRFPSARKELLDLAVRPEPRPVQPSTVLARSIGIGGHLAMPPLPHHRAYGSVPRRFGGLSARQRIHREQSETFEASVGEGAVQRA